MLVSSHFRRALYNDQSPAAADYFEERHSSLFVSDSLQSWVEACAVESLTRKSHSDDAALELEPMTGKSSKAVSTNPRLNISPDINEHALTLAESLPRYTVWAERFNRVEQLQRFIKVGPVTLEARRKLMMPNRPQKTRHASCRCIHNPKMLYANILV